MTASKPPALYAPFETPIITADRLAWLDLNGDRTRFIFARDRRIFHGKLSEIVSQQAGEIDFPTEQIMPAILFTIERTGLLVADHLWQKLVRISPHAQSLNRPSGLVRRTARARDRDA